MKVGQLLDLLQSYNDDEEITIDIYETITGKYVDSTSDVIVDNDGFGLTFRADVEAGKFTPFLKVIQ